MIGLSTIGSISLGWALVAGRNRVPRPAAGNTALRTFWIIVFIFYRLECRLPVFCSGTRFHVLGLGGLCDDAAFIEDHDIAAAIARAAFLRIVGIDGSRVGVTGDRHA